MKTKIDEKPLVSIIMPAFNVKRFIGESIESVLAQTYMNWELIIVDDCSTDDTIAVIKSYDDKRIKVNINDRNSGAAISRNNALQITQGKYVAFLDGDDLWTKDKLAKQVNFMEENKYIFTYTEYEQIDEYSKLLNIKISGPKCIRRKGFYLYNWVGCLTVMYNADKVGIMQIEDIKKRNDYAIWLKISDKYECHLLDSTLGYYRKREGSISNVGQWESVMSLFNMYRRTEKLNRVLSSILVVINIITYFYKQLFYKSSVKRVDIV